VVKKLSHLDVLPMQVANWFKDYFLGNKAAPYPRVADTQNAWWLLCGANNDLEEVGVDTYHHTCLKCWATEFKTT